MSHPSSDENNLTPWQKANRKYLAEQEMKNQEPKKEDITLDTPLSDSEEEKTVQEEQQEESQSEKKIEFLKRSSKRKTVDHITVLFEPAAQFKKSTAQSTISSVSFDHHCIGYTADFFDLLCFSL